MQKQRLEGGTLRMEEGATSQGMRALLEAGKGQEADSLLEPPEGTSPATP